MQGAQPHKFIPADIVRESLDQLTSPRSFTSKVTETLGDVVSWMWHGRTNEYRVADILKFARGCRDNLRRLLLIDEDVSQVRQISGELAKIQSKIALTVDDLVTRAKRAGYVDPESAAEIEARLHQPGWELLTVRDKAGKVYGAMSYRVMSWNQLEQENGPLAKQLRDFTLGEDRLALGDARVSVCNEVFIDPIISKSIHEGGFGVPLGLVYARMHAAMVRECREMDAEFAFAEVRNENPVGGSRGAHVLLGWKPLPGRESEFETVVSRDEAPGLALPVRWKIYYLDFYDRDGRQERLCGQVERFMRLVDRDPD